jgi:predicted acetyltransferase
MIIRQASGSDTDAIATLLSKSFLEDTSIVRVSIENNPRYSLSDMYVIEDKKINAGIVGCLRITPFEVYTRGTRLPMAGIAAVAVQPEARRRGIAEALMEDALRKMYDMDYPISMLFPFKHNFYEKFGYGYVGNVIQYEFEPKNISPNGSLRDNLLAASQTSLGEERSRVRAFTKADRSKVKRVLQQEMQANGGFTVSRNDNFWDLVVFPKFKDAYVYDDGEVKGYMVFEIYKEHGASNGLLGETILNIKEFVGLQAAAHRGLWGFVGALGEQVTRVKFLAPADYPLHLFLREPREPDYRRLFFEYKSFSTLASGFMLRVISVPGALGKLHHNIDSPADFVIRIKDGNLPQNSRSFNLHVHNCETVVDETKQNVQFETGIETFSQIYSGFLRPSDALRFGFAQGEKAIAAKLDELFRAPAPFIYQYDIF